MNKKGMIDTRPLIVLYLVLIVALIFTHYLTFSFPSSIRLINKPWSLPEEIVIGIMIAPIMLLILLFPVAYIEEKHAELMAKKYTKNMELSIIKITEPSTWSKVYHCHIKSDKIDANCKIVCYKDFDIIKSVIFPKEWREKNQEIYNYYAYIANIIKDKLKEFIFKSF
ncbi:hypothetical protein [Thermoanaerobacterium thermosaccharolyticum]|uniref:hypothetical protein n=1 Tax=Thermoanaerobacterium thermosaccharolyticum TaxID=1517 RepID=UPI0017813158|nr:hypothetical protein [Thermoanaerobacterium thermosaccharolyticum]MBE0069895.1 hypothetical protein [Thermoanaerobacterium thermosaccharolyticum]MBE0228023.1 hypothetical protein [Thermoanaerobacterium thermosaccharolyticum]